VRLYGYLAARAIFCDYYQCGGVPVTAILWPRMRTDSATAELASGRGCASHGSSFPRRRTTLLCFGPGQKQRPLQSDQKCTLALRLSGHVVLSTACLSGLPIHCSRLRTSPGQSPPALSAMVEKSCSCEALVSTAVRDGRVYGAKKGRCTRCASRGWSSLRADESRTDALRSG